MTSNYPPPCPKCGGASISPIRAGMSATPYLCTSCSHRFGMFSMPSCKAQAEREKAFSETALRQGRKVNGAPKQKPTSQPWYRRFARA
jgi:hypothetical protein